jgi:hypothetical protein
MAGVLAAALSSACAAPTDAPTAPGALAAPVNVIAQHNGAAHQHFTHLSGGNEVPANDSIAQGQAVFQLSEDGASLHFKLNIANIHNVTQAHIHLGPPDGTGGIVVWLYPSGPPAVLIPGRSQGTLAEGTITAGSLVGALAGDTLEDLLDHIRANNAYVNVHTSQFLPGEIRGQIR